MGALSKSLLVSFEILNELFTAVGAGVLGIAVLLKHGLSNNEIVKCLSVVTFTSVTLIFALSRQKEKLEPSKKKVIFITGCDSGLGFSLAQHAANCGFTVIAGFLNLDSRGSKEIKRLYSGVIIQIHLDVTDSKSIQAAVQTLEHYFSRNSDYVLHAVINNAGVMVFAEFEWLTEKLIQQQVDVNMMGTFKLTKMMCPQLRKHKARLVIVTSHCALANLPGLTVYGATKAALQSWSEGLRIELGKYGVKVLTFIPGSFTTETNIMAKQLQYVQEMHDAFNAEQHEFYSDYFKRYNVYLSFITPPAVPKKIEDENLYEVFEGTILDKQPHFVYKHEPWRYTLFHFLFKISPTFLRDYFVTKFMQMPPYIPPEEEKYCGEIEM